MVAEGDSISYFWGGSYTGIYARTHASVVYHGTAVGGSGIDNPSNGNGLEQRFASDMAYHPAIVTVLIGANDLANYPSADEWLDALWTYIAKIKATGARVALATVLPAHFQGNASITTIHNQRRAYVNDIIRRSVGSRIDAVIDFAADPTMGPDTAADNAQLYSDGVHPTDGSVVSGGLDGHSRLEAIYAPVLDQLLR